MLEIPFSKAVQKGFTIAGTEMGLFLTQTGPQKSRNVPQELLTLLYFMHGLMYLRTLGCSKIGGARPPRTLNLRFKI